MSDARPQPDFPGLQAADNQLYESLRMMYREHTDQARHHDTMRERSTAAIVALAAGLATAAIAIVKLAWPASSWPALFLSAPIIGLGLLGMLWARSHWENNRQHVEIARAFRRTLEIQLERDWKKERGEKTPEEREREEIQKAMKCLADELPQTRRKISRLIEEKKKRLTSSLACLLRCGPEFGKHPEIPCPSTTHDFGTKSWCGAARKVLDDALQSIAPYGFRTIRDYGQARHKLKSLEGEQSDWSGRVARGWIGVNGMVVVFGVALCSWIVVENVRCAWGAASDFVLMVLPNLWR
jgi:hypothetical protein